MTETISTLEVRKRLGDILNRVSLRHDQFVIERKGKPLAAVVPIDVLERLQDAARRHLLESLNGLRQIPPVSQEEADRLADEAKHLSRPESRR